jgi:hypothetical protein
LTFRAPPAAVNVAGPIAPNRPSDVRVFNRALVCGAFHVNADRGSANAYEWLCRALPRFDDRVSVTAIDVALPEAVTRIVNE